MNHDSDSMFSRMYQDMICILALNTGEQMRTWQYILVAGRYLGMELGRFAVDCRRGLWQSRGRGYA
jgi:hypothetical protein